MLICDSHVHVGHFNKIYTSPQEVVEFMQQVGVEKYAVMSTTIWKEDYIAILQEMHKLVELAPHNVVPVLWLSPNLLAKSKLDMMLKSGIHWRALKLHGNHQWSINGVNECAIFAEEIHLPLILHTSDFPHCEPNTYREIIRSHPQVTFILAHCRPVKQAISIITEFPNCYGDTAFMSLNDVKLLIQNGLEEKILYGSDYPIHKMYFLNKNIKKLYCENIASTRLLINNLQWEKISHLNFEKLF